MSAPEPVFGAPWHAQLFAMTVHLNQSGRLAWADWAARFGVTLARHGLDRDLDGGDDYFTAWLETLEAVLVEAAPEDAAALEALTTAWRAAYLNTPHGDPVTLGR